MFSWQEFKFPRGRSYNENCSARKVFRAESRVYTPPAPSQPLIFLPFLPSSRVCATPRAPLALPPIPLPAGLYLRGACSTGIVRVHSPRCVRHVNRQCAADIFFQCENHPYAPLPSPPLLPPHPLSLYLTELARHGALFLSCSQVFAR